MWTTLVDAATLLGRMGQPDLAIVDCRFYLHEPDRGELEYRESHLAGAVYAHLDRDLSGPKSGTNGRHPLPDPDVLRLTLGRLGIGAGVQVVAYDQDNAMFASRLWWLLRWMGHHDVAVLDGGLSAWRASGGPMASGPESRLSRPFTGSPRAELVAPLGEVVAVVQSAGQACLLDARAPERFRGDVEPLDPRAGHIPGAINHFFKDNVDAVGRFLPAAKLRAGIETSLRGTSPGEVIAYCGSGVTACHNLLAMEHAGLPGARLYPGSWSEWSADVSRPVATGEA